MSNAWKFVATFVLGAACAALIPVLVVGSGAFAIAADEEAGWIERSFASLALHRNLATRAPEHVSTADEDPDAIASGIEHYRDTCLPCHGAPGIKPDEMARGMNPKPPDLVKESHLTAGEMVWIVTHGIRMSGMPSFGGSHDEAEIRDIVAAVRALGRLSDEQRDLLRSGAGKDHGHGHGH